MHYYLFSNNRFYSFYEYKNVNIVHTSNKQEQFLKVFYKNEIK